MSKHKLIVDLASRKLTELIEIERCPIASDSDLDDDFMVCSKDKSNGDILKSLEGCYLEVFDPSLRTRGFRHSVVAFVETTSDTPLSAKARRFSPEKVRALQDEIKRLCDQGILEKNTAPGHLRWSWLRKSQGNGGYVPISPT